MDVAISKKLSPEIRTLVMLAVKGTLEDPDFGLELSSDARKRLKKIQNTRQKTIPLEAVKEKYC